MNFWQRIPQSLLLCGLFSCNAGEPPRDFAFVLQADKISPKREQALQALAGCGRDLLVIDKTFGGEHGEAWTKSDIAALKAAKKGRIVLAYLSIGEAEDYRDYWDAKWDADKDGVPDAGSPAFLCGLNPDWPGNYKVRYWHKGWQAIILKILDGISKQGFDGVYLDIIDAFQYFEYDAAKKDYVDNRLNPETKQSFRRDMIDWVGVIAAHGRAQRPGFRIFPQNGWELLAHPDYVDLVDGIGVESLYTDGSQVRTAEQLDYAFGFLERLSAKGKPVLTIEYARDPELMRFAQAQARVRKFLLLYAERELGSPGMLEPLPQSAKKDPPAR